MGDLGHALTAPGYLQVQNGDHLTSQNGEYFAVIQTDGNLCVYEGRYPDRGTTPIWKALNTPSCHGVYFAALQADANLCIYAGIAGPPMFYADPQSAGLWCSGSHKDDPPAQLCLILQDDGHLNVFAGTPEKRGKLLWSSHPHPRGSGE